MVTQRFAFDYPVIIVDDVNVKTQEKKKKSEELNRKTSESGQKMSSALKSEIRAVSAQSVQQAFDCQVRQVGGQMRVAFDKMTQINAATAAAYQKAREVNSPEAIAAYDKALKSMNASKAEMLKSYVKVRRDMTRKNREALAKLQ